MSKIIVEVDGERHTLTSATHHQDCKNCSLKEKCGDWGGFPCEDFEVRGVFKKQEIPEDILPLLLILHDAVKKMRRLQEINNPVIADEKTRWRAERVVDSVLGRIQDYWDAQLA